MTTRDDVLANPRAYWEEQGGQAYADREAWLRGNGSLTTTQAQGLQALITQCQAQRILEVGCGYGRLLHALAALDPSLLLTGIDFSTTQLALARAARVSAAVSLTWADVTSRLPFLSQYFDLVYTYGCLMHIPPDRIQRARLELHRVARHYLLLIEDAQDSGDQWDHAHLSAFQALGCRVITAQPYPSGVPGQRMTLLLLAR